MIGTVLSGYQVISKIKDGSVGTVWKGRNPFNEDVAIKVLSPAHARDAKKLKEFRNEAKTLGQLKHPNIIRLVKFFDVSPQPYLIMEYFKSENLKHAMLNMPERVRGKEFKILKQLCDALHTMHLQNVIHLDIKPENVLVSETSDIRLIDFSIAQPARGRMFKFGKTQWGGTPAYMAPEQIRGEAVSAACDQYAFGVLAYELFARRTPFVASTQNALLEKHLAEMPPPLRKTLPKTPQDVDRVILRMLEKDPASRWADMAAIAYELGKLAEKWGLWWVDAGLNATSRTSAHTARLMQPTTPPQGPPGTARIAVRGAGDLSMHKTHPIPAASVPKAAETTRANPAAPAGGRKTSRILPAVPAPPAPGQPPPAASPSPEPWRPVGERAASVAAPPAAAGGAPGPTPAPPPAASGGRKTSRILPAVPAPPASRQPAPAASPSPEPWRPVGERAAAPAPVASVPASPDEADRTAPGPAFLPATAAAPDPPATAVPPASPPLPEPVASPGPVPTGASPTEDGVDALLQDRLQRRIDEERKRQQKTDGGEGASSEALPRAAPHESDINLPAVR